jgi:hypothetical protein
MFVEFEVLRSFNILEKEPTVLVVFWRFQKC